jgi:uncharacterized protein (TIGR03086 family)
VTEDALTRPTPCRRWDLNDLLEHLQDSMTALQEAIEVGRIGDEPAPADDDVISGVRDRATRLVGSWANVEEPGAIRVLDSPTTAPLVAGAGALEVTVHGWDIARACGEWRPIPDELAEELLDLAVLFVRGPDRPGRFGPPVGVAKDAGAADRLLGFLGRRTG